MAWNAQSSAIALMAVGKGYEEAKEHDIDISEKAYKMENLYLRWSAFKAYRQLCLSYHHARLCLPTCPPHPAIRLSCQ